MKNLKNTLVVLVSLLAFNNISNAQCAVVAPVPNDACYQTVIIVDPFCCNTAWDQLCQDQYDNLGCTAGPPPCPVVAPVPADGCYESVIANDPNCCNIAWDVNCQNAYDNCTSVTYGCTGNPEFFVVPPCITELTVIVSGAQGGGNFGGLGAQVVYTMPVIPGQTIQVEVGCQGGQANGSGGYGGGGNGVNSGTGGSFGGGGMSMVGPVPGGVGNAVVVAGGGGGTGAGDDPGAGGVGGCPNGGAGTTTYGFGGSGGTTVAGGAGGAPWTAGGGAGQNGSFGQGGAGGPDIQFGNNPGGGGGGGYYGGGGGGSDNISGTFAVGGGGGGGGSSLVPAGAGCTQGVNAGDGEVIIAYGCETTPPTASNPAPISVQCAADVPAPNPAVVTDEADNCSVPTVAFVSDSPQVGGNCGGTITRTYSVTDVCLNQILVTQTITIDDTQPPTGTAPADINVQCPQDVPAGSSAQILDEADNCTATPTVSFLGDVSDGNTCPETRTRSWSITDLCGNQTIVQQIITINDTQAPVFAAPPANVTVECVGDVPANMGLGWTDNCDGSGNVGNVDGPLVGGACGGTITRTWSYTDACGNTASVQQIITIDDTQPPTGTAPADINVQCPQDVPAGSSAQILDEADNCTATPTVSFLGDVSDGNTCPETRTRSWSITDLCGNQTIVQQIITINDTQAPVFAAPPANVTVECVGDVPANMGLGWTDNCDGSGNVGNVDGPLVGGPCGGTITRTWFYTDACGNTASVQQVITIDDTTPPTASNPPDINLTGPPVPAPDPLVVTDEADNCSTPVVAWVSDVSDNQNCPETITRTYSVTDACGNTINVVQLIIIGDAFPPTASNPAPINVECSADVPLPDPLVVTDEADNGGVPVVAWVSDVSDGNTCPEVITRTYSVTDNCGNVINVTQTITVLDVTAPVFAAPPGNVTVDCIGNVPAMTNLGYTDNCDPAGSVAGVDGALVGGPCGGTITRTWTFTDACGNVATETQTITVDDNVAPVFAAPPANITVECVADVPAMTNLNWTDNCDGAGSEPGVDGALVGGPCGGTITRTWTYTDACGNVATETQTITVDDTTPPTASNPPNINLTGPPVPAPDPLVVTDEADNCSVPVVAWVSDVSDNLNCPETITRTYSVTDACGNTINVVQLIIIGDPFPPTASNPANIFVMCIGDVPAPDPLVVTDEADNGGVPVVAWVSDVSDNNPCPETITRTYSVTDNCGNVIFVTHDIVVQDLIPPSGTAPGPASYQCIGDVPPGTPGMLLSATDNCTANPTVAYIGDVSDGNTCPETILRSWTITDDCGNVTQVDQAITVNDTQAPVFVAPPANVTVECVGDVPAMTNLDYTDNCDAPGSVAGVDGALVGGPCGGTITRTWTFTDACGNVATETQTITIDDTTPPTASNPAQTIVPGGPAPAPDPNVVIDEADNCGVPVVAFVSQVSDNNPCPETITYTYSVTDACGNTINVTHDVLITDPIAPTGTAPADITVDCITAVPAPDPLLITDEADNNGVPTVTHLSDVSDGLSCPETITRTYRITDPCGNFIDVVQLITVHDLTPPTGTAPANLAVECIGDVPVADPLLIVDEADNCGTPTVAFVGDVSDNNTCPETITRTYSITDSCGNSINVNQTIVVDDITPPTGTAPANVTVECATDVPAADPLLITDEADNCPLPLVVAHVGDVSDNNTCPETITRTYSITDACGNVTNVTQDIIIDDTTNPTASNPASTTIPGGPAPAPDPNVVIDEADNCGVPVVAFVSQVSDNNPCPETITYTYSVTDACGNQITVTHDVIITDPIMPTGTAPGPINVECIGMVPPADPLLITDEADNNGVPAVAHVGDVSDNQSCPETITRTYSITDQCGNQILVDQIITVNDVTPPTASNPANINVECIGDVPAPDVTVVTDEADNCPLPIVVAHVGDVSDNNTCPETITRTYSVTDACGNSITVDQLIIVNDVTPPTASNPIAVNVECIGDVPAVDINVVTDEADNCPLPIVVAHVSDVSDNNTCPEIITRTYSVTDACGNSINVTQTITVHDITNPTASNPADIVQNGGVAPAPDPLVVIDEADNCPLPIVVAWVSDVSDNNPCPETIVRTYSVTDACGNQILVTQNIIINDAILPTGTAPAPITVECIGMVPAPDPLLITDEADNQGVPVVAFVSDVSDNQSCPETITRTYSITDVCNNQILVTQTITVNDITPPTASNPIAVNVECIGDVPAPDVNVVTDEADNCPLPIVVAHVGDVSDNQSCPETITRTYSVTDACGNSINVTQTITVHDITNPTASNPAPVAVQCIADVPAVDINVVTDEADNCPLPIVVAHVSDVSDNNTCPETITRTYSVTDACGNSINVMQTITVNDITNPTASNPANVTVYCASDVPAPDPAVVIDEADNCTAAPIVAHVSDVSDGNVCNGEIITRTYSVTDDCGNQITVTQLITIDVVTPTIDAGIDQAVCDGTSVTLTASNYPMTSAISWDMNVVDGVAFIPPVGTTTYTVTANECNGECFISDQVDVTVNPNPVIAFQGDVLYGCEPHTVNFTNQSTEQNNCVWDFGDGNQVTGCGPVSNMYVNPGLYDVTLTVTSIEGCTSTDTYFDYVEVVPFPIANFSFTPNGGMDITATEVEFTNTSLYSDSYTWNFGDLTPNVFDTDPVHTYPDLQGGTYTVTLLAQSSAGCADTATAVIIIDDILIFYVPNIFTPDGNSINNDFLPIFSAGLDIYDYHLTIFNRWGEIVFESYNVLHGWDGHYGDGGLVDDGVYIWQLDFGETMSDKRHKHRGHVTVLK